MSNPNPSTIPAPRWFGWLAVIVLLGYGGFLGANFTPAAGGSDSSGYLNAARLIAAGHLTAPPRDLSGLTVSSATQLQPLGFIAEPARARLVPTYPLGLPAHLAIASTAFGWTVGPLLVGVGGALAAMLLCYFVARQLGLGWSSAAAGAVMIGAFPVTLFVAIQPLSDVLAMTWGLAATLAALHARRSLGWAVLTGAALAVAVLVRPTNLLLLPALIVLLGHWRPLAAAALGGLPGAFVLGWCNHHLYGSPWQMGYGSVFEAFSSGYFWPTVLHFARWLALLLPGVLLVLPFAALRLARERTRFLLALLLWFVVPVTFYACYEFSHEVWWSLRFILPAVPALILAALLGLEALLARRPRVIAAAATALAIWSVIGSVYWTRHFHSLLTKTYESAYAEAGRWAHDHLPAGAVVFSQADSGAIHYYTPFAVLRWDQVSADEFARHAAFLTRAGRPLYLIVSPAEETHVLGERLPARWQKVTLVAGRSIWLYAGPLAPSAPP